MLFHTTFRPKTGFTHQDQQAVLKLWSEWSPPAGFTIKSFHVSPDGRGFLITETDSAEAAYESTALWASVYLEYEMTPVIEVDKGVAILTKAIGKR